MNNRTEVILALKQNIDKLFELLLDDPEINFVQDNPCFEFDLETNFTEDWEEYWNIENSYEPWEIYGDQYAIYYDDGELVQTLEALEEWRNSEEYDDYLDMYKPFYESAFGCDFEYEFRDNYPIFEPIFENFLKDHNTEGAIYCYISWMNKFDKSSTNEAECLRDFKSKINGDFEF